MKGGGNDVEITNQMIKIISFQQNKTKNRTTIKTLCDLIHSDVSLFAKDLHDLDLHIFPK